MWMKCIHMRTLLTSQGGVILYRHRGFKQFVRCTKPWLVGRTYYMKFESSRIKMTTEPPPKVKATSSGLAPAVKLKQAKLPVPPCQNSILRWILRGVDGIRLPAVKISGTWHTNCEAIDWFFTARTERHIQSSQPAKDLEADEKLAAILSE